MQPEMFKSLNVTVSSKNLVPDQKAPSRGGSLRAVGFLHILFLQSCRLCAHACAVGSRYTTTETLYCALGLLSS